MTTPLTTTYNGWANFETWQFMMWYGDTLQGMVQEIMDEMDDFEYGNAYVIVEGFVDMLMEENNFEGYFSDVVSHTIQMIDLHEIAEHCMEK